MNLQSFNKPLVWLALAAVGVIALAAFCTDADARAYYVRAEIGQAAETEASGFALSDDITYGGYVGTAIGPIRAEVGASRITADFAPVSVSAVDFNATAYLDTASGFYIGAGPDYITAEASFGPFSVQDEAWGYHVTAGYAKRLGPVIGEVAVRYVSADFDTFGDAETVAFTAGVRVPL